MVRVLGYGFGVRGRKVKSRDCALASDLVRATKTCAHFCQTLFSPLQLSEVERQPRVLIHSPRNKTKFVICAFRVG